MSIHRHLLVDLRTTWPPINDFSRQWKRSVRADITHYILRALSWTIVDPDCPALALDIHENYELRYMRMHIHSWIHMHSIYWWLYSTLVAR